MTCVLCGVTKVSEPCPRSSSNHLIQYAFEGKHGKISFTTWDVLENNLAGQPVGRDMLTIAIYSKIPSGKGRAKCNKSDCRCLGDS